MIVEMKGMGDKMKADSIVEVEGYRLSKWIHNKKVSCAEVMAQYLDHIEKVNPCLNAIVSMPERDSLIKHAEEKDGLMRDGIDCGWMHGFPYAVKDLTETKGIRTTFGSRIFKDYIPKDDGLPVKRIKNAGAVIIGKTNTPEFGFGSQTYNEVFGTTGNPYNVEKTCGGSSGGAACSLAARMLPVADGSDYMGSLRNPAGYCNVFGFRPSLGIVPDTGFDVFSNTVATCGPMARNVADLALLLGTLSGRAEAVPLSKADDVRIKSLNTDNVFDKLKTDTKGIKIAWMGDWNGYLAMEKGILDTTKKALSNLESIGVSVEMIKPFFDPLEFWETIWLPLRHYSACSLKVYIDNGYRDIMKPEALWEYEGSTKISAQDVYNAFVKRSDFYRAMMKVYDGYDYIAAPSAQVFPFDKSIHWPDEIEGRKMKTYHQWMEVVVHWSMGCNAVAAVPAGFGGADNLPIGIQIAAKPGYDFELLQFAAAYEEVNDFALRRRPEHF